MPVYRLDSENIYFPLPSLAEPDGLLAVGGDLSVKRLLLAYSNGIFPWYGKDDPILWWCLTNALLFVRKKYIFHIP